MFESLIENLKKKESIPVHITKQHIVLGATFLVAMGTIMSISTFSPGDLRSAAPRPKSEERNVIPKITQSSENSPIDVAIELGPPALTRGVVDHVTPDEAPTKDVIDIFPTSEMKNGLRPKFVLDKMSDAPVGNNASRFSTSYVITSRGESTERYDLVSITRTDEMNMIKTAKDALNVLIEESDAVNIIDYTDDYLIYDLGGSRGYQIGKIMVDDQGIYILGYINFTTNNMPYTLKMGWINRLNSVN